MTIAVIYGGRSGEHEISLISAAAITRAIKKENKVILIGISKEGRWYLQPDSEYERICKDEKAALTITQDEAKLVSAIPGAKKAAFTAGGNPLQIDVIFPALHGTYGEDGTIQGLFEMADIPYVGCTTLASSLTMDKEKTKLVWQSVGLPVVPYVCIKRSVVLDSVVYDLHLLLKIRREQHAAVRQHDHLVILRHLEKAHMGHDLSALKSGLLVYDLSQKIGCLHPALHQEVSLSFADKADSCLCSLYVIIFVVDLHIAEVEAVFCAYLLYLVLFADEYRHYQTLFVRLIYGVKGVLVMSAAEHESLFFRTGLYEFGHLFEISKHCFLR